MNRKISLKLLDSYKRKFFIKNEFKNKYVNLNNNTYLNKIENEYFNFFKKSNSNVFKKTKINNKCLISGRTYNISNKLKTTRFEFRSALKKNSFSGFRKN